VARLAWPLYSELVRIVSIFRAIRRKLTPPGNRGSLDTDYRQPNGPSDIIGTGTGENMRDVGNMSGGGP
jgi:hypothetical protein